MSKQGVLFDVPVEELTKPKKKATPKKKAADAERGCDFCPQNKTRGIRKIMGRVRGRAMALFVQSPGPEENEEEKALIGPSGQLWWKECKRVGIERTDFDIQHAMRCFPGEWKDGYHGPYLAMRNPNAKELHCCSLHTENAVAELKANQIVLLGQVAAKAFLKTKSLPKTKSFWSKEHNAKIYLLDHPSFFVRGGSGERFKAWKQLIKQIALDRKTLAGEDASSLVDPYHYIKKQKYVAVTNYAEARAAKKIFDKAAKKKRRLSVDIENAPDGTITCIGFSHKPGHAYVFIMPAPEHSAEYIVKGGVCRQDDINGTRIVAEEILANGWYQKALHFGCTDVEKLVAKGFRVEGYTHDTYYSEYLRFSDLPSYGLDIVAERRFPEFAGYANIIAEEMMQGLENVPANILNGSDDLKMKYIQDKGLFDIRKLSVKTLVLYNGADCDVTKRVEIDNKKYVPQALMNLYIDFGVLLHEMEKVGPVFDFEQHEKLDLIYPHKTKELRKECRRMVRKETRWFEYSEEFNPGSGAQVKKVLYSRKYGFGLDYPFAGSRKNPKPNTQKMTLLTLAREHEFPGKILQFRSVSKVKSTNESYRLCATANGGRLRTKWNATGARTGRISSSGDKNKKASKQINLQNVKKDAQIRNMCVADPRWKRVYARIEQLLGDAPRVRRFWHSCEVGERKAKKAGKKWKAPEMDRAAQKQLRRLARKIEAWLAKHMPDFKTYVVADFGQVEVRVAAQMTGDKNLIRDCQSADIHTTVGVAMTGWDADKIANDEMTRTLTKNCIAEGQRVLTLWGLVPIEKITRDMLVWDGLEFVSHDGVICKGERAVITYDGLEATPDHEVWVSSGEKVTLAVAQERILRLAITGDQTTPIRYAVDHVAQDSLPERLSHGVYHLRSVLADTRSHGRQYSGGQFAELRLSAASQISGFTGIDNSQTIFCYKTKMRESSQSKLEELRGAGDRKSLYFDSSIREVRDATIATSDIQRRGNRSEGQRRPLRTWKSSSGIEGREREESSQQYSYQLQGAGLDSNGCCTADEDRLSGHDSGRTQSGTISPIGYALAGTDLPEGAWAVQKKKVYDIVNAGPRHRFTVEGRLVSNCHFAILFGANEESIFEFINARTEPETREEILAEFARRFPDVEPVESWKAQMVKAYRRYFKRYPKVAKWIIAQRAFAEEMEYVTTMFGMIQTLNVTTGDRSYQAETGESGGREAYWGNQALNGPIQGSAHQFLICAMVNLIRKRKRYAILGIPPMEVHDALYFVVDVLKIGKACQKIKYLMEQESLNTVRRDFPDIEWTVPIVIDLKAGVRLGTQVKVKDDVTPGMFILDWFRVCKKQMKELDQEILACAA